jgi:hypothetical protein
MGLWRDMFGPGQDEIWGSVAKEINADYTPGGWLQKGRIDLHRDSAIITLDTYAVNTGKSTMIYTRMRTPFRNSNGMAMNIYRESIFSWLGKLMGMSDITVGDAFFDKDFVVQGSPESKIVSFLTDPKLKQLIEAQPHISFKIREDDSWFSKHYPDGIDELYFQCGGIITDEQRLKNLFELFNVAADKLAEVDPGCVFGVNLTPK